VSESKSPARAPHLAVKNWAKFQHYKTGKNNVWIKVYAKFLDDLKRGEMAFGEVTQAHLLKLWLAALRFENRLPLLPQVLAYEISAQEPIDWRALLTPPRAGESGWLYPVGLSLDDALAIMCEPSTSSRNSRKSSREISTVNRREEKRGEERGNTRKGSPVLPGGVAPSARARGAADPEARSRILSRRT
jgi:hypothetical protein